MNNLKIDMAIMLSACFGISIDCISAVPHTQNPLKLPIYVRSPNGTYTTVQDITAFCLLQNLDESQFRRIIDNQSAYKGFMAQTNKPQTLARTPKAKGYTLTDPQGTVHTTDLLSTFCKEHDLSYKYLYRTLDHPTRTYRGWKITRGKNDTLPN